MNLFGHLILIGHFSLAVTLFREMGSVLTIYNTLLKKLTIITLYNSFTFSTRLHKL